MAAGYGVDTVSFVTSAGVVLPITITAGSNDQFEYNEVEYLIPAGTYKTVKDFCNAINRATNDEDFTASPKFNTLVFAQPSGGSHAIQFFSKTTRASDTKTFGTGAEHDALAGMGLTDGWLINRTQAASVPTGKSSGYGEVYGPSIIWDGIAYVNSPFL